MNRRTLLFNIFLFFLLTFLQKCFPAKFPGNLSTDLSKIVSRKIIFYAGNFVKIHFTQNSAEKFTDKFAYKI